MRNIYCKELQNNKHDINAVHLPFDYIHRPAIIKKALNNRCIYRPYTLYYYYDVCV